MGNKKKFDDDKAVKAFINCAKKISDVKEGPLQPKLFTDVCIYLKIRKKSLEKFRTNVKFAWSHNVRNFRMRVEEGIKKKLGKKNKVEVEDDSEEEDKDSISNGESAEHREEMDEDEYPVEHVLYVSSEKIIRDSQIAKDLLHSYLRRIFPSELGITCVLQWRGMKLKSDDKFRDYAQCKQPECKRKFKFHGVMQGLNVQIKVFDTLAQGQHTESLVYQLRDADRIGMQGELLFMKPSTMHTKLMNDIDIELAQTENNYQFAFSREVLQKARSEKLTENDRHSDDGADIYFKMKEAKFNHPYIREFKASFTTYLASKEQVEILRNYKNLILHFDATGSIVRKSFHQSKRVYYYAGVVVINKKIYLLMALITNSHTVRSIQEFLSFMKYYWEENGISWPAFQAFVTDMSWASINALMRSFNDLTVLNYLKIIWKEIYNNIPRPKDLVSCFTCYAHLMKMLSRQLKTLKVNEQASKVSLEAMAIVIHSQNLQEMSNRVELLFTILLTPKLTNEVRKAIEELSTLVKAQEKHGDEKEGAVGETEELSGEAKTPNYQQSPFWIHFKKIYDKVLRKAGKCKGWAEDNEFANVAFADYLLKTLFPYAPLWSTLLTPSNKHIVNTPAENHMKQIKCEKEENMKIGRFINVSYNRVTAACKELALPPPKNHQKATRKRINEADDDDAEEQWNRGQHKKRKTNFSYQQGKNLQKETDRLKKTLRFNDNHTITDPNYYFPQKFPPQSFTIVHDVNEYDGGDISLLAIDYGTLFNSQWLNNFLIDYWMVSRVKFYGRSDEVLYINCERSKYILEGKQLDDDFCEPMRQLLDSRSEVLLPCNVNNNHWVLVYVNITEAQICYFDSVQPGKKKEKQLVEEKKKHRTKGFGEIAILNFIKFYKKIYPGPDGGWWRTFNDHPSQKDTHNCGIFIIHFMEEILSGKIESIGQLDPDDKREELKHIILRQSLDVAGMCLHCGYDELMNQERFQERSEEHWVQCRTCRRWAEYRCVDYLDRSVNELQDDSFEFDCGLCSIWRTSSEE